MKTDSGKQTTNESLTKPYWNSLIGECKRFADRLSQEIRRCQRDLSEIGKHTEFKLHEPRLKKCAAFGQHLQKIPLPRQGQFGLYGTAAGIELLVHCEEAKEFVAAAEGDRLSPGVRDWTKDFIKVWKFLDLVLSELYLNKSSDFYIQAYNLLRICHVLRAVAKASPILNELSRRQKRKMAMIEDGMVDDLANGFRDQTAKSFAVTCFNIIKDSKVELDDPDSDLSNSNYAFRVTDLDTTETTFKFSARSKDAPENWKDWLFLWSSVIASVVRAAQQKLIEIEQVETLIAMEDIDRIKTVIGNKDLKDSKSKFYKLFALWALDHFLLDRYENQDDAGKEPEGNIPAELIRKVSSFRQWLESEVSTTCEDIIKGKDFSDVHAPYHFYLSVGMEAERHCNDYYVIPLVPVFLDMLARHKPESLFRPQILDLIEQCFNAVPRQSDIDEDLPVIPHQFGNYNGTVNAIYYVEAMKGIARKISEKKTADEDP